MDQLATLRLGLVVLAVALALGGCGRKGPLELPPQSTQTLTPAQAEAQQARVAPASDDAGLIQPPNKAEQSPIGNRSKQAVSTPSRPINGPEVKTGKPFILDPLL